MPIDVSKTKAFIDNGQIKITDENGLEYIACQKRDSYNTNFWNVFGLLSSSGLIVSLFFLLIPIFGYETTLGRGFFFFISSVACLIAMISCLEKKEDWKKISQKNIAEYNLAKHHLQPKIMELQKVLAQHKCEIINIEREAKFNFKKKDNYEEMTA